MKNFLLIDDHEIIRTGIKVVLLETFTPCKVYEASDEDTARVSLTERNYDLIILDIQMPRSNAMALLEFIKNNSPDTKVLILSMTPESAYARKFLKAGAKGFVSKSAGIAELRKAIELAMDNKRYVSTKLADQIIDQIARPTANLFDRLSTREFEIFSLLVSGHTAAEISTMLSLEKSTTGTYKKRIFEKLGVKNILELSDLARGFKFEKPA